MLKHKIDKSLGVILAFAVMVSILAGCTALSSKDIPADQIAHFTICDEHCVLESESRLAIYGALTNDCDVPVSKVIVRYRIYGDDGREAVDYGVEPANEWELYYTSLNPGESVEFRVSGDIGDRGNGVSSFEFDSLTCVFDEESDYRKKEVVGYVTREESQKLVFESKERVGK